MIIFHKLSERIRNSLINKFVLVFLFGGILPVLILSGWTVWVSHRAANLHISDSIYRILKEKIDFSVLRLQEIESLIANISGVEDITTALNQDSNQQTEYDKLLLQAKIGYILNGYINIKGLESIDIISTGGNRYHVGQSLVMDNQSFQPILKQILAENKAANSSIVWHGVLPNLDNSKQHSLIASRELVLTDPDTMTEKSVGILIVQFSLNVFNSKFLADKQNGFSYIILDNANNCILSPNPGEIGQPFDSRHRLINKSSKDNFVYVRLDNRKVFQLKYTSEFNHWTYYVFLSKDYVGNMTSEFTRGTITIMLIFLLLTLLINGIFLRYLLVPVKKITSVFAEISENRYDLTKQLPNPHTDEIGDLIKWFNAFMTNLVDKEHYQAELEVQKELAEKANKAKDVFLANVSHELRTPLNGVISVAELLDSTSLNAEQHDYTKTILQSGEILYSLINQVLDFSKIASDKIVLQPQDFDFIAWCDKLANLYLVQANIKHVKFIYHKPERDCLYISADEMALQKIIINLLGNSLKFTAEGTIAFSVSLAYPTDGKVLITIAVSDTGIGIPEDKLGVIFNAFEQVDNSLTKRHGGTGLGLAIAQQLAYMMKSQIEVQSPNPDFTEGSHPGTRFSLTLELPLSEPSAYRDNSHQDVIHPLFKGKYLYPLIALIVEDNPINQKVLSTILSKYRITFDIASDWETCLRFLAEKSYNYIFMDIQMPGMTGFDLTIKIRSLNIVTPIVAITGNALKEMEEQAYRCGMNAFIVKPIRISELEKVLLRFLPSE